MIAIYQVKMVALQYFEYEYSYAVLGYQMQLTDMYKNYRNMAFLQYEFEHAFLKNQNLQCRKNKTDKSKASPQYVFEYVYASGSCDEYDRNKMYIGISFQQ